MAYKKFTVGEKEVEALCTARTPITLKQVFGRNFFDLIGKEIDGDAIDIGEELLYICHKAAKGIDPKKLNRDSFYEWLEDFDLGDMIFITPDVIQWAISTNKGSVDPKK